MPTQTLERWPKANSVKSPNGKPYADVLGKQYYAETEAGSVNLVDASGTRTIPFIRPKMTWGLAIPTPSSGRDSPGKLVYLDGEFSTTKSWYDVGHLLGLLNGGSDTKTAPYYNFMPQVRSMNQDANGWRKMEDLINTAAAEAFANGEAVYFGVILDYNPAPQTVEQIYVPTSIKIVAYKVPIVTAITANMAHLNPSNIINNDALKTALGDQISTVSKVNLPITQFDNIVTKDDIQRAFQDIAQSEMMAFAAYNYGKFFDECFDPLNNLTNGARFKELFDNFFKETSFIELADVKSYDPVSGKSPPIRCVLAVKKLVATYRAIQTGLANAPDLTERDAFVQMFTGKSQDPNAIAAAQTLVNRAQKLSKTEFIERVVPPELKRTFTEMQLRGNVQDTAETATQQNAANVYQKRLKDLEGQAARVGKTTHSDKKRKEPEPEPEKLVAQAQTATQSDSGNKKQKSYEPGETTTNHPTISSALSQTLFKPPVTSADPPAQIKTDIVADNGHIQRGPGQSN